MLRRGDRVLRLWGLSIHCRDEMALQEDPWQLHDEELAMPKLVV